MNLASSYYHEFAACAPKALRSQCGLPAAERFFQEIVDHVFGEVLNLACGKYKSTGACAALPKLSTKDDRTARNRGFIEPLTIIASRLG